jgi:hypothetical protein
VIEHGLRLRQNRPDAAVLSKLSATVGPNETLNESRSHRRRSGAPGDCRVRRHDASTVQRQVESLLVAAGFRLSASTDKQLQQVPTLPPGQVTVITDTGKNWYVYPDCPRIASTWARSRSIRNA